VRGGWKRFWRSLGRRRESEGLHLPAMPLWLCKDQLGPLLEFVLSGAQRNEEKSILDSRGDREGLLFPFSSEICDWSDIPIAKLREQSSIVIVINS
jgi:hypothetical protein